MEDNNQTSDDFLDKQAIPTKSRLPYLSKSQKRKGPYSMNASLREKLHRKQVERTMNLYRSIAEREENVYKRISENKYRPSWGDRRIHDYGVTEAIMEERNQEWRDRVALGMDIAAARPSISKHVKLPRERRAGVKRRPVLYWGC